MRTVSRTKRFLVATLFALTTALRDSRAAAEPEPAEETVARGGRVGWARLVTPSRHWSIHEEQDAKLATFIHQQTSLNIDTTWYAADPAKLEALCKYPFIYAKDLSPVRNAAHLENLREYLRRGGFFCIDACGSPSITPDGPACFRGNREILQQLLPGAEVRRLPTDHPIYRCYFNVSESELYTRDMGKRVPGEFDGLHGVFDGERMAGVISMYGLECGWPQTPMRTPGCMKMIVNLYVYAMTGAIEPTPAPPALPPPGRQPPPSPAPAGVKTR